jgi:hypothetical protein
MRILANTLQTGLLLVAVGIAAASGVVTDPDGEGDGNPQTVIIDSAEGGCFTFETGSTECPDGPTDIMVEPWCTALPGICGNWVVTEFDALGDVTTPPTSGYISDEAGYEDCQEADTGKVIVFKLGDGSYAKGVITNDDYTEGESGCDHRITLEYVYPM